MQDVKDQITEVTGKLMSLKAEQEHLEGQLHALTAQWRAQQAEQSATAPDTRQLLTEEKIVRHAV